MYEDKDPWPFKCPECGEEFTKEIGWLKTHTEVKCPGVLNTLGPILCPITITYRTEQFCLDVAEAKGAAMTGRTAAYGRAAFAWAVNRGAVAANPFANLPVAKGIAKRERVLSDDEIAEIWRAAGKVAAPYGAIVRLLILTGQRRGEVAGMNWGEISNDLATWTMPGERTKNGAPHMVPLSAPARDLLRALLPEHEGDARRAIEDRRAKGLLALPGALGTPFAGWSKAKAALDKAAVDARAKAGTSPALLVPCGACTICAGRWRRVSSALACGLK
jgi:integrase